MNTVPMASAISTSTSTCMCSASSIPLNKGTAITLSTSAIPNLKLQNFGFSALITQLGPSLFSRWNGLRPLSVSISPQLGKPGKGKCKGKAVYASLFGVGAPEALVIGVVALLVFGPKGLAEVARNLGKTLRAFQPTIKELQDVSREFKSTLEQEIGLDEIQSSTQNTFRSKKTQTTPNTSSIASSEESRITDPNVSASSKQAYPSEEYLKVTEQQLNTASVAQQQSLINSPGASQLDSKTKSQDTVQEAAAVMPPPQKHDILDKDR